MTASFINGLFITFLPLFLLPVLGDLGSANSTYSDADYGVFGVILGHANIVGGRTVLISVILIALILFYSVSILMNKRDSNNFEKVEEIK